jgi:hypothetical protein
MVHALKPKNAPVSTDSAVPGDVGPAPQAPAAEELLPDPQVIREQFEQYRRGQLQVIADAVAALEADRADLHRQYQEAMAQLKERILAYKQVGAEIEAQGNAARAAVTRPRPPAQPAAANAPAAPAPRGNGDEKTQANLARPAAAANPLPPHSDSEVVAEDDADGDDEPSQLKADGRRIVMLLRERSGWVSARELARLTRDGQVEQALATFNRQDLEVRGYGTDAEYRWVGM